MHSNTITNISCMCCFVVDGVRTNSCLYSRIFVRKPCMVTLSPGPPPPSPPYPPPPNSCFELKLPMRRYRRDQTEEEAEEGRGEEVLVRMPPRRRMENLTPPWGGGGYRHPLLPVPCTTWTTFLPCLLGGLLNVQRMCKLQYVPFLSLVLIV